MVHQLVLSNSYYKLDFICFITDGRGVFSIGVGLGTLDCYTMECTVFPIPITLI